MAIVVSSLFFIAIVIFFVWRFTCLASKTKNKYPRHVCRSHEEVSGEGENLVEVRAHVTQTFGPTREPLGEYIPYSLAILVFCLVEIICKYDY